MLVKHGVENRVGGIKGDVMMVFIVVEFKSKCMSFTGKSCVSKIHFVEFEINQFLMVGVMHHPASENLGLIIPSLHHPIVKSMV